MIKQTTDTKSYPHTNEPYIFSGLLSCPVCGSTMTGFIRKRKLRNGSVSIYKRYRCQRKLKQHSGGACVSETVLEAYMLEHLCDNLSDVICALQASAKQENKAPAIRAEIDRLNLMYQKGRITDEYYESQYEALTAALQEEKENTTEEKIERYIALKKEFSGNWKELYDMMDSTHKNAFWKRIVKKIYIDKNTHKIRGFSFL